MTDDHKRVDLNQAARRGLRRAGLHLVKAAIEVVAGVGALIDELQSARSDPPDSGDDRDGRQRIDLD